jgi:hypothetical protein
MVNLGAIIGGLFGAIVFGYMYENYDTIFSALTVPSTSPFYYNFKSVFALFAIIFMIIFLIGFIVPSRND